MSRPFVCHGTFTALVTPFVGESSAGGDPAVDWARIESLVERQIAAGIDGLVPCGTTGESPTLSTEEQREVVARTVTVARGRAFVLAGAGSSSTAHAVELAKQAERAGADAVMVVAPYYNRPSQAGLEAHFVAVASAVGLPVVLYNVPVRTGCDVAAETVARVCERAPNVVAVKEASGNVLRAQDILGLLGDRVTVMCGDDALTLPMVAVGARGVISVTSNLLPAELVRATKLSLSPSADLASARRAHLDLLPVHRAMFCEASPAPVKAGMALSKLLSPAVRSPIVPASAEATRAVEQALAAYRGS
jgi:4-hydroxy-tetrahydrodipicolinate synthase